MKDGDAQAGNPADLCSVAYDLRHCKALQILNQKLIMAWQCMKFISSSLMKKCVRIWNLLDAYTGTPHLLSSLSCGTDATACRV